MPSLNPSGALCHQFLQLGIRFALEFFLLEKTGEHGGKDLAFVDENKVVAAWFALFGMKIKRTPMGVLLFVGIFVHFMFQNKAGSLIVQGILQVETLVGRVCKDHNLDT